MLPSTATTGNADSEYTVVRLSKNNLADVAKLHTAVYGIAPAPDHFPRKYNTAYTGVEYTGFIAYNREGLPVAYYGVIPCFIRYGDEIMLAAQSADTMTHPKHRYKGMFVELSNMTFGLCRELGIGLVFGFPNQHSYHGAVHKLGWKMTETMDCFVIPVSTLPLEWLSKKSRGLKKIYGRYRQFILEKYAVPGKGLANAVLTDGYAGLWRSDDYLQYKLFSGAVVVRVGGSRLWLSNKQGLLIGDAEGVDGKTFPAFMQQVKKLARKLGIRQVQFHSSTGTGLHSLFAAKYKAIPSYPVLFQDFGSAIPVDKIKFTFADIDIF
jgi:hypothetical protein